MIVKREAPRRGALMLLYWVSTCVIVGYLLQAGNLPAALCTTAADGPIVLPALLAAAAILIRVNVGLSDLAYAGVLFHLCGRLMEIGDADPLRATLAAGVILCLAASFFTQNNARRRKSPYGGLFTRAARRPYGSLFLKPSDRWDGS
jgi:hypothetical protein